MKLLTHIRVIPVLVLLGSLCILASVAFVTGRTVNGLHQAAAQVGAETTRTPAALPQATEQSTSFAGEPWYKAIMDEDRRAPVFDDELNGIRIGPAVKPTVACAPGEASETPIDLSVGTSVEISPGYLPAHSTVGESGASACRDEILVAHRTYTIAPDAAALRYGGKLQIVRRVGGLQVPLEQAATRASATTIVGRPAVAFRPLTSEGWGPSALVIAEPWGTTTLQAIGFSAAELRRLAEGLYR